MKNENEFQPLYDAGLEQDYTIESIQEALDYSDISRNASGKYYNLSGDNPEIMNTESVTDIVREYHSNSDPTPVVAEYSRINSLSDQLSNLKETYSLSITDTVDYATHLDHVLTLANQGKYETQVINSS